MGAEVGVGLRGAPQRNGIVCMALLDVCETDARRGGFTCHRFRFYAHEARYHALRGDGDRLPRSFQHGDKITFDLIQARAQQPRLSTSGRFGDKRRYCLSRFRSLAAPQQGVGMSNGRRDIERWRCSGGHRIRSGSRVWRRRSGGGR